MKRTYLLLLALAVVVPACGPTAPPPPPPPPTVLVYDATRGDVPVFSDAIATLDGSNNTQIHPQITGALLKIAYQEGALLKPGDLLFQIDPKPYQADLDKAQATLVNKQAQYLRTKQDLDRYALLVKSGAVSQQEYQTELQNNLSAQADVNAAQASVDTAKINLGYTTITSPIGGIAGRAIPGIGDIVAPETNLTTISTLDPIQADFTIPEQFYLNNAEKIAKVSAIPLAERPDSIELILANGTPYSYKGKFYYVNRQIQTATGAISAFALFPNPNRILRPGQYAKVRAITREVSNAVLIPRRAISELQGIDQVFVVGDGNKISTRIVTLGDTKDAFVIITDGVQAGDKVVVEGLQKCRDGAVVDPQPYAAPDLTPKSSTNSVVAPATKEVPVTPVTPVIPPAPAESPQH